MSNKKLCFGLKKSKAEPIDHVVSFNYEKVDMPVKFNLKDRVKQIYDQKNMNACSANATASLISLSKRRRFGQSPKYFTPSAKHLY